MKRLMVVSGVFSLLLASFSVAFAEQGNRESPMISDTESSDAVKVERAVSSTEKSEFSAMESESQPATKIEKSSSDDLDNAQYIPRDWYDASY